MIRLFLISGNNASQVRYAEFAQERAALKGYLDSLSGVAEDWTLSDVRK